MSSSVPKWLGERMGSAGRKEDDGMTSRLVKPVTYEPFKNGWIYYVSGCPHRFLLSRDQVGRWDRVGETMAEKMKQHLKTCFPR